MQDDYGNEINDLAADIRRLEDDIHGDSGSPGLKSQVAALDTKVTVGFLILGALIASPKLGGPSIAEAAQAIPLP